MIHLIHLLHPIHRICILLSMSITVISVGSCTSARDRTLTQRPIAPEPSSEHRHGRGSLGMLQDDGGIIVHPPKPDRIKQLIPGTKFEMSFVHIPAGALEKDGETIAIQSFYMLDSEVTWDAYDVFLYEKDRDMGLTNEEVDAVTRPSKPYIPPDRGYGHDGYPAIGVAHQAAVAFCQWLSAHSGKTYRLPTEYEWEYAAGANEQIALDAESLDQSAWTDENAELQTQPVRTKRANAWGLYDMFGNAAEWVADKDADDPPFVRGGHFMNTAEQFNIDMKEYRQPNWSMSDPQVPKSPWWLSDGPHVGFRIVCEEEK